MEMVFSIPLEKIDLNKNQTIKSFYEFYSKKCKLVNPDIFALKMAFNYNDLEPICKFANCFALDYNNKGDDYNIIYYDSGLCNEEFKKKKYWVYFLEKEIDAKLIISEVEAKANAIFNSKTKKE